MFGSVRCVADCITATRTPPLAGSSARFVLFCFADGGVAPATATAKLKAVKFLRNVCKFLTDCTASHFRVHIGVHSRYTRIVLYANQPTNQPIHRLSTLRIFVVFFSPSSQATTTLFHIPSHRHWLISVPFDTVK
jgi:hypothetical protein